MAKYVNLDDVIEHLEMHWGYEGLREDLYELPTADVATVRRGRGFEVTAGEKRLIDATDAEKWAHEHILDAKERYTIVDFLRECSTVDAVEVVRCKDCKYWDVDPDTYGDGFGPEGICFGICDGAKKTKHDDFCFCGERRCEE